MGDLHRCPLWRFTCDTDDVDKLSLVVQALETRSQKTGVSNAIFESWRCIASDDIGIDIILAESAAAQDIKQDSMRRNVRNWCGAPLLARFTKWDVTRVQDPKKCDLALEAQPKKKLKTRSSVPVFDISAATWKIMGEPFAALRDEGYFVLTQFIGPKQRGDLIGFVRKWTARGLQHLGVSTLASNFEELVSVPRRLWNISPKTWPEAKWNCRLERGWAPDLGGGKLYRHSDFTSNAAVVRVQESLRPVISLLHGVKPKELVLNPEGVSVKPPGCPALVSHLDPPRAGTYQVIVALTDTSFVLFPRSHKKFVDKKTSRSYTLTDDDIKDLAEKWGSVYTEVEAKAGDVCIFEGGTFAHGSPSTRLGDSARIVTFCHYSVKPLVVG